MNKTHIIASVVSIGFVALIGVFGVRFERSVEREVLAVIENLIMGESNSDQSGTYRVKKIIDGDTILLSEIGTVRLIGIDTPETKDPRRPVQCFGEEASQKTQDLLQNTLVGLIYDSDNVTDTYGRTLAYVIDEEGRDINALLIEEGYAFSYKSYPHPRLSRYNQLENQAREAKRGLWSSDTCNGESKPQ